MRYTIFFCLILFFQTCRLKEKIEISFPEGGYSYPQQIESGGANFFNYPVKDFVSTKDSFWLSYSNQYFFNSFEEPNLSIRPPDENIFRFCFMSGLAGYEAVLTLTRDKIIVKEVRTGYPYPYPEDSLLIQSEVEHYNILRRYFPLNEYQGSESQTRYIDSITKIYPELLDPSYYRKLLEKCNTKIGEPFTYRKWTKSLSTKKFLYFVDKVNKSGFWKVDPMAKGCGNSDTDGDGYCLEAATPLKYHVVYFTDCDELQTLNAICYELMEYSGMKESMNKRWENIRKKNME